MLDTCSEGVGIIAIFQDHFRPEILDTQIEFGRPLQCLLWNESDDFTAADRDSIAFGLAAHGFKNQFQGCLLKISEVHGNLSLVSVLQQNAHRLDIPKAAA
jgi:hypothetical protein